jgi:membrane protease YdiL (CAAX protease family)
VRPALRSFLLGAVVLGIGYGVVWLNGRIWTWCGGPLGRWDVSSLPFYAIWLILGVAYRSASPGERSFGPTVWSKSNLMVLLLVAGAAAFLYQRAVIRGLEGRVHAVPPLVLLSGGVLGPIVEEWLFRGLLWTRLRRAMSGGQAGRIGALIWGSIVFGLWHLSFEGHSLTALRMALVHAVFGGLMGLLRWRLGSATVGAAIHALGNSLTILTS